MTPSPARRTTLRIAAGTALVALGAAVTAGCLLALFLANLTFFGERPQVPLGHTLLLLAGAAAGIGVPVLASVRVLDTWRRRLVVPAAMLAVLLLGAWVSIMVLGT